VNVDSQNKRIISYLHFIRRKSKEVCLTLSFSLSLSPRNMRMLVVMRSTKFCTLSLEYEKLVFMCGFSSNFVSCYLQPPAITQAFVGADFSLLSW